MATADEKAKIATLENQVATLKQQLSDKNEALDTAVSTGATRQEALARSEEALQAEKAAHADTFRKLIAAEQEITAAGDFISELNEQLNEAQEANAAGGSKAQTVKHDGITYEVAIPRFRFEGKVYTAADVTEGSALLAGLVRKSAGVLLVVE